MPAVAVTDTNNMFCALEFSGDAARAGVQPIIGLPGRSGIRADPAGRAPKPPAPVVLLAQNEAGYET
jgi:DNA polymerase-3 subunit alpha